MTTHPMSTSFLARSAIMTHSTAASRGTEGTSVPAVGYSMYKVARGHTPSLTIRSRVFRALISMEGLRLKTASRRGAFPTTATATSQPSPDTTIQLQVPQRHSHIQGTEESPTPTMPTETSHTIPNRGL